jgi:3'(2'), 5'-bisphosphate nucleotidase
MAAERQSLCAYLEPLRAIAVEAGRRILQIYARDFSTVTKEDGSPLTEADRASHNVIVSALKELTPRWPVLSEESASVDYAERARWETYWLVDPLDGTREFVKRNGEFTVNIALVQGQRPVVGVVYVPVTGVGYAACPNTAYRYEDDGPMAPIHARSYCGGPAKVVASRSHRGDALGAFFDSLNAREGECETVSYGSSLKLCLVAEGGADVYPRLGPTSEWDTAAAQCVVEAAGGRVVDVHNQPLRYNKPSLLNPWFIVTGSGDYDWTVHVPAAE